MILTWHLKWERPMMNSLKSTSPLPSSSKMSMTRLKSQDIQCQLSFQSFLPLKQGGSGQHFCAWRYCGAMDKLFGLPSWGGAFKKEYEQIRKNETEIKGPGQNILIWNNSRKLLNFHFIKNLTQPFKSGLNSPYERVLLQLWQGHELLNGEGAWPVQILSTER